jgi:nanoRNase/pAp phosphatase (c-di-AMP/oligoRNAs hydrolase)
MEDNLERLHALVQNKRKVLIATHNNPDPDSIASASALQHLFASWGINSVLVYGGIVGRAENKAMITKLRIPLRSIHTVNPSHFIVIALLDCQPFSGNSPLPRALVPSIVIDHHPARKPSQLKKVPIVDIRSDYGSTSSIVAEYLLKEGVDINRRLATALYYGIMADTRYLGRDTHEADIKLSATLYPKVLRKTLSQIEYPPLPRAYFRILAQALARTLWYPPQGVVISELGEMADPDMVAIIADFLIRMDGARWVMVFGTMEQGIFFSLRRARYHKGSADKLARYLIRGMEGASAGGHEATAGGRWDLAVAQSRQEATEKLKERFLKRLNADRAKGIPIA